MELYDAWHIIVLFRFKLAQTIVNLYTMSTCLISCGTIALYGPFLAHLAWAIVITFRLSSVVRRPSVNISYFNLLLRNHWTNCNQTLVEWSLDGPLSNLCLVIPTSNQDGRQAKNRKKRDEILIVHCCFSVSQNELKF
jgi:hypothetical protein